MSLYKEERYHIMSISTKNLNPTNYQPQIPEQPTLETNTKAKIGTNSTPLEASKLSTDRNAQIASDLALSANVEGPMKKTVGQVVVENTVGTNHKENLKTDNEFARNVGAISRDSNIASTVDNNQPPAEIHSRNKTE